MQLKRYLTELGKVIHPAYFTDKGISVLKQNNCKTNEQVINNNHIKATFPGNKSISALWHYSVFEHWFIPNVWHNTC